MNGDNPRSDGEPVWRRSFEAPQPEELEIEDEGTRTLDSPAQRRMMAPKPGRRDFRPWLLVTYLGVVAVFAIAGAIVGQLVAQWTNVDIEEAVKSHQQNVSTQIYDLAMAQALLAGAKTDELEVLNSDGSHTIGELAEEKRILVSYEQIPEDFIKALITAEDKDFMRHQGVDMFQYSYSQIRVSPYRFPVFRTQGFSLPEDLVGNTDFADIVQQCRGADCGYFVLGTLECFSNICSILTYLFGVAVGIMVLGVDCGCQSINRTEDG